VYVQRVVTGVSGSAGSLQALRYAAAIARSHDATLVPVLAWNPPGGEIADRRYPCPQLREAWVHAARNRLWQAVELSIGAAPADIEFAPRVERGEAGEVLTRVANQDGDVLVIGAGRAGAVHRLLACRVSRYCLAHAVCPVIAVPPSPLAAHAHGVRAWVVRHRIQPEDADLHVADA
jgi:nucleotide-binding universal stress UspA family protein